ncbi:MAG: tRNA-dihydrouridine synthase family protein [Desulfobulbaceae bacterium]|nr:tRNA-dihydrouridine synthase family protein [Desulfobulbaceae bacterium]
MQPHPNSYPNPQITLYLAPIRGITDALYRNAFVRYFSGFDLAVAPFVTTQQGNRIKPGHLRDLEPKKNRTLPIIPQILSKDPDHFITLAQALIDQGHKQINWNLGCPYPMVANKKRGSGLLPYPDRIASFLDKIRKLPVDLSIKTRLGRFLADEILQLMPIFNDFPLTELIIHPRTGKQMYKGKVDLEAFGQCLEQSRHPVIYNGDITDENVFLQLQDRFKNVAGWMIGRGALADPFLPARIKKIPLPGDKREPIRLFHNDIFGRYQEILFGPSHILGRMKGLWFYLSQSFANSRKILKKIQKTKTLQKYNEIVEQIFSEEEWIR